MSASPTRSNSAGQSEHWRGLDELARQSGCANSAGNEFPPGAREWRADMLSRRHFLLSASLLLAGVGLSGCRRPTEEILPFATEQDGIRGQAEYYATAMPRRRSAIPLLVKSNDGRPTKIEGNPNCPGAGVGTDAFAQASLLGLYDPDRAAHFAKNGQLRSRKQAMDFLASRKFGDGARVAFLGEQSNSPSRERLVRLLRAKLPRARWFEYEPIDLDSPARSASLFYGKAARPRYKIDKARTLLALDCDFLGAEEDAAISAGQFAATRRLIHADDPMSRLYTVESLFTITGANADHRLRAAPGMMLAITARFALELLGPAASQFGDHLAKLATPAAQFEPWIIPCARDLASAGGDALILPGHRLPPFAQILIWAMNHSLGAVGRTVHFEDRAETAAESLADLTKALLAGSIDHLIISGGNPGYNAPPDLNWPHAQARAHTVIRLGPYIDETSWDSELHAPVHWDFPAAHYLESWGDARIADGVVLPVQPLIEPLFDGMTELELLARIAGIQKPSPYAVVRETFNEIAALGDDAWKRFLHTGFLAETANHNGGQRSVAAPAWPDAAKLVQNAASSTEPSIDKLDVVFHRDYSVDDGRYANNGWLQELPDPITKLTWDNAILISPATARELHLDMPPATESARPLCQMVELELDGRTVRGPIWVQPGMADHTLALALGYGRSKAGRIGNRIGFNAYCARSSATPHYGHGAILRKIDGHYALAITQSHWSIEGRSIARQGLLETFRNDPAFAKKMDRPLPGGKTALYPNPLDAAKAGASNQWGMSIDLNACVGCSACVIACQSENNIPIVGKEMIGLSREMHWLRIDRYYSGPAGAPTVVNQPMLCQHCEAAPCESVCPVDATVHDEEGLNVMVYNRCVGTRYCSNNCPFKVRRFNFFDYNRRPLNQLYKSPLTSANNGQWELKRWAKNAERGGKPDDEWRLARMARNPDVTARMRGVMEKCSFCQQRLEQARIAQKVRAGASLPAALSERDGAIPQTACQQACPSGAIVFGDISDPQSKVSAAKSSPRDYQELDFLNIKPRVSYQARVRNPNPAMPL